MNIYVSNLSFNVQDEGAKGILCTYGEVTSAKVINDKETGQSRGFGFVEMPDDAAAKKAIAELDQATVEGRSIRVTEADLKRTTGLAAVAVATKVATAAAAVVTTETTVGKTEYPYVLIISPGSPGLFYCV